MYENYILKKKDLKIMAKVHAILLHEKPPEIPAVNLAKQLDMPRNKLNYLFKKVHGFTIFEFREWRKMERAKRLLATTQERIETIALLLGYCKNAPFSAAFKRKYGISPAEFRREIQAKTEKKILKDLRKASGANSEWNRYKNQRQESTKVLKILKNAQGSIKPQLMAGEAL